MGKKIENWTKLEKLKIENRKKTENLEKFKYETIETIENGEKKLKKLKMQKGKKLKKKLEFFNLLIFKRETALVQREFVRFSWYNRYTEM